MDFYLCPLCKKQKAWISSTYPLLVVHNCQGKLEEVGKIVVTIENGKNGQVIKNKEYIPVNAPGYNISFKVKPVETVAELKNIFMELKLNTVSYFSGQSYYQNFPFWEKLWEYRCYKVLNLKNNLCFLILLDHDYNFRQNATACMGYKGQKPTAIEAGKIIKALKELGIKVGDESVALHYISKPFAS